MDDSSSGKVQAEELPVSPDDNEVVMQNKRPAKRSTFELDQPPVSVKAMRPSNGLPSKSKKRINWAAIHQREFDKMTFLSFLYVHVERIRRRLMTPVKRAGAAAFAAKIAGGPQQQETNTANVQKSLTKPAVFAPSVLSTKQINTNFSTKFKSPASVTSRTPFKLGQSGKKSIVEENASSPAQSSVNGSLLSTTIVAAKRPVFGFSLPQ